MQYRGSRGGVLYPRSLGEFQSWFATDGDCLDYLERLRWPDGFVCPRCENVGGLAGLGLGSRHANPVKAVDCIIGRGSTAPWPTTAARRLAMCLTARRPGQKNWVLLRPLFQTLTKDNDEQTQNWHFSLLHKDFTASIEVTS